MKIQWNKVTWYSKLIALVLFVALPFIGFYYGTQYGKTLGSIAQVTATGSTTTTGAAQNSDNNLSPYYSNIAEWQTDFDAAGGFAISYPIDFDEQDYNSVAPSMDWRVGANGSPGIEYFSLTVPKAFEPQTNFDDAKLTVGASQNDVAISQCLTADESGGPVSATSSETINGVPFTVFNSTGVGAGNYYETTSYRTLHAGKCYAIEYTLHSSQVGNYPSSYGIQQFDKTKITSLMHNILGTFKFL